MQIKKLKWRYMNVIKIADLFKQMKFIYTIKQPVNNNQLQKYYMGNIEIQNQSPNKKRTTIFQDLTSINKSQLIQKKSLTPKSNSHVVFSPIKFNHKRKQIFDTALTERRHHTSRISSKFSNNKSYIPINDDDNMFESKKVSNVKTFADNLPSIRIHQKENLQSQSQFQKMGKIVTNSRRNNFQKTIQTKYIERQDNFENTDILKKVRNFNDFLNQIKRKLKQDKQRTMQRKRSSYEKFTYPIIDKFNHYEEINKETRKFDEKAVDRLFDKASQKHRQTRKLQVALKLQNEKIELEKYRKLVERELSKNHSIQSISLSTKKSGQRILTIEYDNLIAFSEKNIMISKQQQQRKQHMNVYEMNRQKEVKKQLASDYQRQKILLQKLKGEYESTMRNMIKLGKDIQVYQKRLNQTDQSLKKQYFVQKKQKEEDTKRVNLESHSNEQINKIQDLFSKLSSLQDKFAQTDRQIKQILNSNQQQNAGELSNFSQSSNLY